LSGDPKNHWKQSGGAGIVLKRKTSRSKKTDRININEEIRAREVRVINPDGSQVGILPIRKALESAVEHGLDLVEISPNADPPVCKIMDYGRYKYEQTKKQQEAKKKQTTFQLKEIKVRPKTGEHDLQVKIGHIKKFLTKKDKVKVTVMFRGREIVHRELGRKQLDVVVEMLGNLATVENPPRMEGRFLSMILVPNREGVAEAKRAEEEEEKSSEEAGENAEATS
jgi:translation initiation factor IF-3